MAKLGIDLSKFKKISHDKDSATLKHADGHEFKIALSALHPSSRGDVARMPLHKMESKEKPEMMSADGKIAHYNEGTKESPVKSSDAKTEAPSAESIDKAANDISSDSYEGSSVGQGGPLQAGSEPPAAAQEPSVSPDQGQPSAQANPQVSEQPIVPQQAPLEKVAESEYGQQYLPGIEQEMHGREALASAQAALGAKQAKIQQDASDAYRDFGNRAATDVIQHKQELENAIQDFQKFKINPNNYLEHRSTFDTIRTGIGMIVAGAGSGGGRSNPVIDFVNSQIDRDIKAQQDNAANKYNLVNAYSRAYQDSLLGREAAKNLMTAKVMSDMKAAEAEATSPQAKANLQVALGQMANQYGMNVAKFGAQKAFYGLGAFSKPGQNDAAEAVIRQMAPIDPKAAENMQKHFVPGIGVSSQEVPEKARMDMMNSQKGLDLIRRVRDFSEQNHGLLAKANPAMRAQADTLVRELHQAIRTENGMGVFKPAGEKFESMLTGTDPLGVFARYTQEPKLKELESIGVNDFNRLKAAHGLHDESQVSSHYEQPMDPVRMKAVEWAKAHPNHPSSTAVLKKHNSDK